MMEKSMIESKKTTRRDFSVDILRIISMLMIVSLHFFSYNPAITKIDTFSATGFLKRMLHSLSLISVNCYVLISGYYIHKFKFSLNKLLRITCEVFFYSMAFYFLFLQTDMIDFTVKELFFAAVPVLTRQYWFVTTYVGVYCLSPIIRDVINLLDKKSHSLIVVLGFLLFVVYYNLFFFCDNLNFGGSTGIVWFIYLYFCASYVRKYNIGENKHNFLRYIICAFLAFGSEFPFVILYIVTKKSIFLEGATIFNSVYNSIFVFMSSLLFFIAFVNTHIDIKSAPIERMISFFASGSFAVYLIHENKYMRMFLWNKLALNISFRPIAFVLYWICTIVGIYIACASLDWFRRIVEWFIFGKSQKLISFLEKKLQLFMDAVLTNM